MIHVKDATPGAPILKIRPPPAEPAAEVFWEQVAEKPGMSVVVALKGLQGGTWIGSDTLYCSGNLKLTGPKWVVRQPWAVGVAGHLRSVNTLQHYCDELFRDLSATTSGAYEFTKRARDVLREDGFHENGDNRGPLDLAQTFVLAHADDVWTIGSDFSISPVSQGVLWAEGSGRELALGAGHALAAREPGLPPRDIVTGSVGAAIAFDTMCGGEIWVEQLRLTAGATG